MKFGIIGFGNLGKAFIAGLCLSGVAQADVCITARSESTRDTAKSMYPDAFVTADKLSLVRFADTVVLAVEPQNADEVLNEINGTDLDKKIVLSFISGVETSAVRRGLGRCTGEYHIVKAMPNVAISAGHGVTAIVRDGVSADVLDKVSTVFDRLGLTVTVEERNLPAVTVAASCGTAFAAVLIKAYQDTAEEYLPDGETAAQITEAVFAGTLSLIRETGITAAELPSLVATKGGATQAGIDRIKEEALRNELAKAFHAAYGRCAKIHT